MRNRIVYYNRDGYLVPSDDLGELLPHDILFESSIAAANMIGVVAQTDDATKEAIGVVVRRRGPKDDIFNIPTISGRATA